MDEIIQGNKNILFIFEAFDNDLSKIIRNRAITNQRFKEEELWRITETILATLAFLEYQKMPHGMIQPSTILIAKKEWKIFATQNMLNEFHQSYKKSRQV